MSSSEPRGRRRLAPNACGLVLALASVGSGCSQRTLTLVVGCPDAGAPACGTDAGGDARDAADASDATDAGDAGDAADANVDALDPAVLRQGLVGLWHFDEAAGSTVAQDASGNGNNGTLMGLDPTKAWVQGRLNGALNTNGAGYALVPLSPSIDAISTAVSVSAWFYFDGTIPVDYGTAISRQAGTEYAQYYHLSLYQDGTPTLFITMSATAGVARPTGPEPVVSRRWTHLAGTWDGKRAVLYVDGVEAGSRAATGTFATDTTPVILGGNTNLSTVTELFPGRIDEVGLWNRALSADEVKLLAAAPTF